MVSLPVVHFRRGTVSRSAQTREGDAILTVQSSTWPPSVRKKSRGWVSRLGLGIVPRVGSGAIPRSNVRIVREKSGAGFIAGGRAVGG